MMNNTKWVWLDCDGTFVDLYGVDNWLDFLLNENPLPYEIAKPLVNLSLMARTIHKLQNNGYKVGIISWLSKNSTLEYDKKVTLAKMDWLKKHLPSVCFDEILITPYGVRKADTCRQFGYGILIDDEDQNRCSWDLGETINANENFLEILKSLLDN